MNNDNSNSNMNMNMLTMALGRMFDPNSNNNGNWLIKKKNWEQDQAKLE